MALSEWRTGPLRVCPAGKPGAFSMFAQNCRRAAAAPQAPRSGVDRSLLLFIICRPACTPTSRSSRRPAQTTSRGLRQRAAARSACVMTAGKDATRRRVVGVEHDVAGEREQSAELAAALRDVGHGTSMAATSHGAAADREAGASARRTSAAAGGRRARRCSDRCTRFACSGEWEMRVRRNAVWRGTPQQ